MAPDRAAPRQSDDVTVLLSLAGPAATVVLLPCAQPHRRSNAHRI
jgi:hypothetical protein